MRSTTRSSRADKRLLLWLVGMSASLLLIFWILIQIGKGLVVVGGAIAGVFNSNSVSAASAVTPEVPGVARVLKYPTRELAGRRVGGLYLLYLTTTSPVPDTLEINFHSQLEKLWDTKIARSEGNPVVRQAKAVLLAEYLTDGASHMTLHDYIHTADMAVAEVKERLDWDEVARLKRLTPAQTRLVREISVSITGRELIAYALTELMPAADGRLNLQIADFLLRNAGREYLENIPAIYDPKTSFGPYQFTEYALYDAAGGPRGASVINRAMRDGQIPGSVIMLRGNDHHKAAYMFAIDNIANLVRRLNANQLRVLQRQWKSQKDGIIKYIATAHHGPAPAMTIARRWLDNGARADYSVSAHGRFIQYSRKTDSNLRAIQGY